MIKYLVALAFFGVLSVAAETPFMEPARVRVNGVELAWTERGSGEPVILIHGGIGDYSSWEPQIEELSRYFRVISYSRRYSYPNHNASVPRNYSCDPQVFRPWHPEVARSERHGMIGTC